MLPHFAQGLAQSTARLGPRAESLAAPLSHPCAASRPDRAARSTQHDSILSLPHYLIRVRHRAGVPQNAARLQLQNDALLAERVDLYMKMQSLESSLSVAATERDNLDKELKALVNIPTKWLAHSCPRLRHCNAYLPVPTYLLHPLNPHAARIGHTPRSQAGRDLFSRHTADCSRLKAHPRALRHR